MKKQNLEEDYSLTAVGGIFLAIVVLSVIAIIRLKYFL